MYKHELLHEISQLKIASRRGPMANTTPDHSSDAELSLFRRKLIDASHILHYHGVLDAYGHVSFRHPFRPDEFVMSRSIAPGTVSSPEDLVTYSVRDASPVEDTQVAGFIERMIHSETYKRHSHVQSIVHSHSEDVVSYSIAGVPFRACYHMAGFLGARGAPVFDIAKHTGPDDLPNMLVCNTRLGAALATCFDDGSVVALMRGHGFTTVAGSIELAVLQAVYTKKNAIISTTALSIQAALSQGPQGLQYLSDREAESAAKANESTAQRPWRLWVEEVRACSLYTNSA